MCLYSETAIPSIAQEDIVCYKYLQRTAVYPELPNYRTPYYMNYLSITKFPFLFEAKGNQKVEVIYNHIFGKFRYMITEGFIHCHRYPDVFAEGIYDNLVKFKCIIPKGSKFYTSNSEICANKIIFLKE